MLNPALAGGALFDLGPYALLWSTLFLYQHPQNEGADPEDIKVRLLAPLLSASSSGRS